MDGHVVALIIFVALSAIFIVGYVLNKRVPIPEGCEEIDESCLHCANTFCKHNPNKENDDLKEE